MTSAKAQAAVGNTPGSVPCVRGALAAAGAPTGRGPLACSSAGGVVGSSRGATPHGGTSPCACCSALAVAPPPRPTASPQQALTAQSLHHAAQPAAPQAPAVQCRRRVQPLHSRRRSLLPNAVADPTRLPVTSQPPPRRRQSPPRISSQRPPPTQRPPTLSGDCQIATSAPMGLSPEAKRSTRPPSGLPHDPTAVDAADRAPYPSEPQSLLHGAAAVCRPRTAARRGLYTICTWETIPHRHTK